jgi:hypothetical protein
MKKTVFLISLLAIGAFVANAQDDTKSPTKSQDATKSQTLEQSPSDSRDATAPEGMSSTKRGTQLKVSDLPKVISDNISSQYSGWTTQEVFKVDNQGATAYEVVVGKDNAKKSLFYDANGIQMKSEKHSSHGKSSSTGSGSTLPETETK